MGKGTYLPSAAKLRATAITISFLAIVVGLAGLAAWTLHISVLASIVPGSVRITVNTAICMFLLGLSLWLQRDINILPLHAYVARGMAIVVSCVGILSLLEFIYGWDLRIDRVFVTPTAQEAIGLVRPGLMSPITAMCFLLLGLALALLDWMTRRGQWPAQALAIVAEFGSSFALLDYILAPRSHHIGIALPTAVALCAFPIGVLCIRPERGLGKLLLDTVPLWSLVSRSFGGRARSPMWRYGIALAAVAAATVSTAGLESMHVMTPFLTFYPAVMIVCLLAGVGPGLLAVLLSGACADYLFLYPRYTFGMDTVGDAVALDIFLLSGAGYCLLLGTIDLYRQRAEADVRRAEAEIRKAESQYKLLVENLVQKIAYKDCNLTYISCNSHYAQDLHISSNQIAGKTDFDFYPPDLAEKYRDHDRRIIQSGKTAEFEEYYLHDGNPTWVNTVKTPVWDENGKVTGVLAIAWDISDRKRAEKQLREQAALLDLAHDAIIVRSMDAHIVFWNRGASDLYGWSAEEAIGEISHQLLKTDFSQPLSVIEAAVVGHGEWEGELTHVCRDGRRVIVASRWSVQRDDDGRPIGCLEINRDITDRKRAEAALRTERHRFEAMLDALPAMICLLTPDYGVAFANRAMRKDFGSANGRKCHDYLYGSDTPCNFCEAFRVLETGKPNDWEAKLSTGSIVHVYDVPFTDSDGSPLILEMDIDVTEQRKAEQQVRAERQKFHNILDVLTPYVVLLTPDYHVAFANSEFRRRFGESHGKHCYEFLFGLDAPCENCETYKVLDTGKPQDWEWTGSDGRSYEIHDFPFTDTDGSRLILEMGIDVTERKQAELARQESETRFSVLVNFAPQMVWMCHPDGMNFYFNQRWVDYTGLTLEESYGRGWNTPFHPDDRQAAWKAWNHAIATGETYQVESRLRATDGTYRWFLIRGMPLLDQQGKITRWFGTSTDIHDLKCAEDQLRRLNEELELRVLGRTADLVAVNKELESFNYAVAHDLRAPLRHIRGFSDLLVEESGAALDEKGRRYLSTIQAGVSRMGQLIDDLLNLSRLGRQEIHVQTCGVRSLVDQVIEDLAPLTEARSIEWHIGDLPFVQCDPPLLKQVLMNLLSNAVKFTRGREPAVIAIGQTLISNEPVIFVRDNGVGFEMKYYDKLFGLFQRLHRQEDFEGTGIGLTIVQRIMHRHGGCVWAESELNKGTTFYISFHPVHSETKSPIEVEPGAVPVLRR